MKLILHVLCAVSAFFGALAMLVSCTKDDRTPQEQNVVVQINLDSDKVSKATPTEQENIIGSVRIYAYREDTGDFVGQYFRQAASSEPIFMDLALPVRGQYNVEFYIFVNETSVNFSDGSFFP